MVVFLDRTEKKEKLEQKNSVDRMCGIFAGKVPFSVSNDFAKNKQKEILAKKQGSQCCYRAFLHWE